MNRAIALPDILSTFPAFSNQWQEISKQSPTEDMGTLLTEFLDKWKSIGWLPEPPVQANILDVSQLTTFFMSTEPAVKIFRDARRSGEITNVWKVAGLKRDEVRISSVFAWFLNQHGEHGQGDALLSSLVKRINYLYPQKTNCPLPEHIDGNSYWVNVESRPLGEQESRVDIEIVGEKFLLFIEVKIDAQETNNQIKRYLEIGDKKSNGQPWLVVFLTPTGKKPKNSPDHSHLLSISWKDVDNVFRSYAKSLEKCYAKEIIQQFSTYISEF